MWNHFCQGIWSEIKNRLLNFLDKQKISNVIPEICLLQCQNQQCTFINSASAISSFLCMRDLTECNDSFSWTTKKNGSPKFWTWRSWLSNQLNKNKTSPSFDALKLWSYHLILRGISCKMINMYQSILWCYFLFFFRYLHT